MNKKIKIIELWNIIAQVEDIEKLPKKIKYDGEIYELQTLSRDYYCTENYDYFTKRVNDKPFDIFLNDIVEILEDNTEEIILTEKIFVPMELNLTDYDKNLINNCFESQNALINQLVRAVNKLRKEKE